MLFLFSPSTFSVEYKSQQSKGGPCVWKNGNTHKTGFKLMVTLQSGCVPEILTLCRIHEIFFQKYHEKAKIHSFPTMYNTI